MVATASARCFIIAEAGVNHNGSLELALQLVDVAARAGADAIKFQTFRADRIVQPGTEKAAYQKNATGDGDQYSMIRALELSDAQHREIFGRCVKRDIEFMSTPFDVDSVELLMGIGVKRLKIPSGEITNKPLLEHMAKQDLPLILSTGMASLDEVRRAVSWIGAARAAYGFGRPLHEVLTVLHCTSNYPAEFSDVNLRAMTTLGSELALPTGYSDHTLGIEIAVAAAALGARVVEKHFTIDPSLPGPDHRASLDPDSLCAMIEAIRNVEVAQGSGTKEPVASELPIRALVRRSAVTTGDLFAGASLSAADIIFLRPGNGIPPFELDQLVGKTLIRDVAAGTQLAWSDFR